MATTVNDRTGEWVVDVGDELTQTFPIKENGGPVDNFDDCVVQVDIRSEYGLLTLRTDDASPQVNKSTVGGDTFVSITLTEEDTSANYIGQYRIVVIDPIEGERTTHTVGTNGKQGGPQIRVVGNWNNETPASFSPTITPIPDAVVSATVDDYLTTVGALLAANDLSDVDSVPTARTNLDVYSTGEVDAAVATVASSPVVVTRTAGDISLVGDQAGTWVDVDPDGNANARALDLVVAAEEGQTIGIQPIYNSPNAAGGFYMDFATYVAGVKVRGIGDATTGTPALWIWNSLAVDVSTYLTMVVQAGDLDGGNVRLRLQRKWTSQAGNRTIRATTAQPKPIRLVAHGPFG